MSTGAFERYASFIQEYIYRKKWTDLKEVQTEACDAIMDTNKHVIIASGTASGKTEAAFFPILTLLEQNPSQSIGVMYIGPLKALINDQFERLNDLLENQEISVWPWHGDISQTMKKRALKSPQGIIQITPESLEALLVKHPGDAYRLFCDLRFVVIDEIHALMGKDRGLQVLCLLSRIEKITGCAPRRIGLSATMNDYLPAMDYLSAGSKVGAIAVGIQIHKRTISLCVESFSIQNNENDVSLIIEKYYNFIYNNCHSKKCLIFTNSRSEAEDTISKMKRIAKSRNEQDVFYVHHGSVSASLRQETEHVLRNNVGPTVAAATLTLELGIDIGDLDSTIQLGAPFSCSSFVQRLGRSGRRTGKSQMLFVEFQKEAGDNPFDSLPWSLLRSIAIIQLYLEEQWVEPFEQKKKPFSLLAHQTLSFLMMQGEVFPADLARNVLFLPPFRTTVSIDEYKELLQYMLKNEYIQRMDNGGLIVGEKGERITNHYSFYAVFKDEDSYRVVAQDGEVGTLQSRPVIDAVFVLAGHSWQTISIDDENKTVYVKHAEAKQIPIWSSSGDNNTHEKIARRMKQVLQEDTRYSYLQPDAEKLLIRARMCARKSGLLDSDIIPCGEKSFYFAPWIGGKELNTIYHLFHRYRPLLDVYEMKASEFYIKVTSGLSPNAFLDRFVGIQIAMENPDNVLPENKYPMLDKYDYMVPKKLLRLAFLYNKMNVPAAISIMNRIHAEMTTNGNS